MHIAQPCAIMHVRTLPQPVRPVALPEHRPQVTVRNGQSNQRDYVGNQEENYLIYPEMEFLFYFQFEIFHYLRGSQN